MSRVYRSRESAKRKLTRKAVELNRDKQSKKGLGKRTQAPRGYRRERGLQLTQRARSKDRTMRLGERGVAKHR